MRLFLMRHATTEKPSHASDFERLLTNEGKEEALEAAKFLHEYQIDKILVSYVKRTMQTCNLLQELINVSELEIVTELYNSDDNAILNLISQQEERNKHILVIGHNPLIYDIALMLANKNSKHYELLVNSVMPPARVVVIDFSNIDSWQNIANNHGEIIDIFTPETNSPK